MRSSGPAPAVWSIWATSRATRQPPWPALLLRLNSGGQIVGYSYETNGSCDAATWTKSGSTWTIADESHP